MNDHAPLTSRASAPLPLPVMTYTLTLKTEFAARVYRRCFDRLKGDLYVLTVRTTAFGLQKDSVDIESGIAEVFSSLRKDLDAELERSDALLDDAKLVELAQYNGVEPIEATYSTPLARDFLDLLLKMDQLLMRYDALWLGRTIDTQQRWSRCINWQRRLTKVANRLREQGNRTRPKLTRESQKEEKAVTTEGPAPTEGSEGAGVASAEATSGDVREALCETEVSTHDDPEVVEVTNEEVGLSMVGDDGMSRTHAVAVG
jgi:hypothetical protein